MAPLVHRSIGAQGRSVGELVHMVQDGTLLVDTSYQRGDVWTTPQRVNLLKSLLLGIPVPAIIVNLRGDLQPWRDLYPDSEVHYALVDGKQRLTTLRLWMEGKLRVPAEWFDDERIAWASVPIGAMNITFDMLTLPAQRGFKRMVMPFAVARLPTLAEEVEVYLLINREGVEHTEAELAHAQSVLDSQRSQ